MDSTKNLTTGFNSWFNLPKQQSAFIRITFEQKVLLVLLLLLVIILFADNWLLTVQVFFSLIIGFYFLDLVFNLFLIYRSFLTEPEIGFSDAEISKRSASGKWPSYTIFCPLYKEWQVLPQFVTAMSRLDYPKDKLQVMLLLEEQMMEPLFLQT